MDQKIPQHARTPGTAVLVAAPSLSPESAVLCGKLLAGADPGRRRVLFVTLLHDSSNRIRIWTDAADGTNPRELAVLTPSDPMRSQGVHDDDAFTVSAPTRVERVRIPPDLTELGIKLTDITTEWADRDGQVVVCFNSLSVLLQYADEGDVFRFLQVLLGKLKAVDAVAHVHVDPGVHDEVTLGKFTSLFDAVYDLSEDGEWAVRSR